VRVVSPGLGLSGEIDEVIAVNRPAPELIPVDYKLSRTVGEHFKLQLAAYAMMLETQFEMPVTKGYLYLMPARKAESVPISKALRNSVHKALAAMRRIAEHEYMPPPTQHVRKCVSCEFRRFCNDVT
jgi:CRISPR-associated exonuclease Cas4